MERTVVLVALDGSTHAAAALPQAQALAAVMGYSIRLLSVVEAGGSHSGISQGELQNDHYRLRHATMAQYLADTAETIRSRGFVVSTDVVSGDPAGEILTASEAEDVALVVLATHGRGAPQRLMIGSVADKVLRRSTRPTALIRPDGPIDRPDIPTIQRIMVPLDGSPLAESVLPIATELAVSAGATLVLIRVEPYVSLDASVYETAGVDLASVEAEVAATAEAYLAEVAGRVSNQVAVDAEVLRGFPAIALIDAVSRSGIDLVVMATHGRGGFKRLVLGSTAERLVRGGVPTLLVRPNGQVPPEVTASIVAGSGMSR